MIRSIGQLFYFAFSYEITLICSKPLAAGAFVALGWYTSQLFVNPAQCEEEAPAQVEEEQTDYTEYIDNFTEITDENIKEVLSNSENKFIFYFSPSKTNKQFLYGINQHAIKMREGLRCTNYYIDMDKNGVLFSDALKGRNASRNIDEQIQENTFILANKDDDIWFWDEMLITYFQGELLEQIFNFYNGVRELRDEHELMITLTDNDNHFITF
jgi:hypothetical protein